MSINGTESMRGKAVGDDVREVIREQKQGLMDTIKTSFTLDETRSYWSIVGRGVT